MENQIKTLPYGTPLAMRGRTSQFHAIVPKLRELGCIIGLYDLDNDPRNCYLINNLSNEFKRIGNLSYHQSYQRTAIEEWNEELFLSTLTEINNQIKMEKTYKITRQQLEKIHGIACSDWKSKIEEITETTLGVFKEAGALPHSQVHSMFEAATPEQKLVLSTIFPEYKDNVAVFICERQEAATAINNCSNVLFGSPVLQLLDAATPTDKPHLKHNALFVSGSYKVECGPGLSGTYIHITKNL